MFCVLEERKKSANNWSLSQMREHFNLDQEKDALIGLQDCFFLLQFGDQSSPSTGFLSAWRTSMGRLA
jgi:hypothetical protein